MWQPASLPAARIQIQPATNPAARLDSGGLAERAAFYFAQRLADSSYRSGQKRYLKFCEHVPPASVGADFVFVADLADEHLKHRTVKMYLSGLRFLQVKAGLSDPFQGSMPRLTYILRGNRANEAKCSSGIREHLPITPCILRKLRAVWSPMGGEHDTKLVWAASCLLLSCGWVRCLSQAITPSTLQCTSV